MDGPPPGFRWIGEDPEDEEYPVSVVTAYRPGGDESMGLDSSIEGPDLDAHDTPILGKTTMEDYAAWRGDYVTVAMDKASRLQDRFMKSSHFPGVAFRVRDNGPYGNDRAGDGWVDIAWTDPQAANNLLLRDVPFQPISDTEAAHIAASRPKPPGMAPTGAGAPPEGFKWKEGIMPQGDVQKGQGGAPGATAAPSWFASEEEEQKYGGLPSPERKAAAAAAQGGAAAPGTPEVSEEAEAKYRQENPQYTATMQGGAAPAGPPPGFKWNEGAAPAAGDDYIEVPGLPGRAEATAAASGVQPPRAEEPEPKGMVEPGNIDTANRPVVKNADGTISTELSFSINEGGKEVLLPSIVGGKKLDQKAAIEHYKKTGEHLGKFSDVASANAYAEKLHARVQPTGAPEGFKWKKGFEPEVGLAKQMALNALEEAAGERPELPRMSALDADRLGLKAWRDLESGFEVRRAGKPEEKAAVPVHGGTPSPTPLVPKDYAQLTSEEQDFSNWARSDTGLRALKKMGISDQDFLDWTRQDTGAQALLRIIRGVESIGYDVPMGFYGMLTAATKGYRNPYLNSTPEKAQGDIPMLETKLAEAQARAQELISQRKHGSKEMGETLTEISNLGHDLRYAKEVASGKITEPFQGSLSRSSSELLVDWAKSESEAKKKYAATINKGMDKKLVMQAADSIGGSSGAIAALAANPVFGTLVMASQQFKQSAEEYRESMAKQGKPLDEDKMYDYATEQMLKQTPQEFAGDLFTLAAFKGMARNLPKGLTDRQAAVQMVKGVLASMAGESLTQAGQTQVQERVAEKYGVQAPTTEWEKAKKTLQDVAVANIQTAALVGIPSMVSMRNKFAMSAEQDAKLAKLREFLERQKAGPAPGPTQEAAAPEAAPAPGAAPEAAPGATPEAAAATTQPTTDQELEALKQKYSAYHASLGTRGPSGLPERPKGIKGAAVNVMNSLGIKTKYKTRYQSTLDDIASRTEEENRDEFAPYYKQYEDAFKKLGISGTSIKLIRDRDSAAGIIWDGYGNFELHLDPDQIIAKERLSSRKKGVATDLTVSEELTHAAEITGIRDDWIRGGRQGDFRTHVKVLSDRILRDMEETIDFASDKEKPHLYKALVDSWRLYNARIDENLQETTPEYDAKIFNKIRAGGRTASITFVFEFARMAKQLESKGIISEATGRNLWEKIGAWVEKALQRIYRQLPGVREGKFGYMLKNELERIDDVLKSHRAELKPSPLAGATGMLGLRPGPETVNIGMNTDDGKGITQQQILDALSATGVNVTKFRQDMSRYGEPTIVAYLDKSLEPDEAFGLSKILNQQAIAVQSPFESELYGPMAEAWRPFDKEQFLDTRGGPSRMLKESELPWQTGKRQGEKGVAAAVVNLATGKVGTGRMHAEAYKDAGIDMEEDWETSDAPLGSLAKTPSIQGFITNTGRFSDGMGRYMDIGDEQTLAARAEPEYIEGGKRDERETRTREEPAAGIELEPKAVGLYGRAGEARGPLRRASGRGSEERPGPLAARNVARALRNALDKYGVHPRIRALWPKGTYLNKWGLPERAGRVFKEDSLARDGTPILQHSWDKPNVLIHEGSNAAKILGLKPGTYPRRVLHEAIINYFLKNVTPNQANPVVLMLGGGPAAGKTELLKQVLKTGFGEEDSVRIAADDIRDFIPEYEEFVEAKDRLGSEYSDKEAGEVTKMLIARARGARMHIIHDGLLRVAEDVAKNVQVYRDAGYKVRALMLTVDPYEALIRSEKRGKDKGRFTPYDFNIKAHKSINEGMSRGAYHDIFGEDDLIVYENSDFNNPRKLTREDVIEIGSFRKNADLEAGSTQELIDSYSEETQGLGERKVPLKPIEFKRDVGELARIAEQYAQYRTWYQDFEKFLMEFLGEDRAYAPLITEMLAATSPNEFVDRNTLRAIKALQEFVDTGMITAKFKAHRGNLLRAMQGLALSGPKVGEFSGAIFGNVNAMAIDRHVGEILFDNPKPTPRQIKAAKERIRQVADRLGWTPREAQAALRKGGKVDDYGRELKIHEEEIRDILARDRRGAERGLHAARAIRERIKAGGGTAEEVSASYLGARKGPQTSATQRPVVNRVISPIITSTVSLSGKRSWAFLNVPPMDLSRLWNGTADVFLKSPGLEYLGHAIQKHADLRRKYTGKYSAPLAKWYGAAKAKRQALSDFESYWKTHEKQGIAAANALQVSPDARRLIDTVKGMLNEMGDINQKNNVHVFDPHLGKFRPIGKIGPEYFPRMISRDVMKILHNPASNPAAWNQLKDEMIAEGLIPAEDPEAAMLAYVDNILQTYQANGFFGSLDKARTMRLPSMAYDFSLDTINRYVMAWSERMSQIESFGQKLGTQGKDLFDKAQMEAGDHYTQKYIQRVRDLAYNASINDGYARILATLNNIATGLHLGNPLSAAKNWIGGMAFNAQQFGVARTMKALFSVRATFRAIKDAKERGIIMDDLMNLMNDGMALTEMGGKPMTQGFADAALTVGGFNAAETWVRGVAVVASRAMLRDAIRAFHRNRDSSRSRAYLGHFKRLGLNGNDLILENGVGELTDAYLRASVNEIQGGYTYDQVPAFMDTPVGRFLFKYQKWGVQQLRHFAKEVIRPAMRAFSLGMFAKETITYKDASGNEVTRNVPGELMPLARYLFVLAAAGAGTEWFLEKFFNMHPRTASIAEAMAQFRKGQWEGTLALMNKIWAWHILAGSMGALGNYVQIGRDFTDRSRFKNPLDPPGLQALKLTMDLGMDLYEQGGRLTPDNVNDYLMRLSSQYRTAMQAGGRAQDVFGTNFRELETVARLQDYGWLRGVSRRYNEDIGVTMRRTAPGRISKGPQSPFRDALFEDLVIGDTKTARNRMRAQFQKLRPEDQKEALTNLKASMRARQPIKAGAGGSEASRVLFLDWAKRNLPREEVARVQRIDHLYRRTAQAVGVLGEDVEITEKDLQKEMEKIGARERILSVQ